MFSRFETQPPSPNGDYAVTIRLRLAELCHEKWLTAFPSTSCGQNSCVQKSQGCSLARVSMKVLLIFQGAAIPVAQKTPAQVLYQLPIFPVSVDTSGLQDRCPETGRPTWLGNGPKMTIDTLKITEVCRYMTFDPLRKNHMWHCLVFFTCHLQLECWKKMQ